MKGIIKSTQEAAVLGASIWAGKAAGQVLTKNVGFVNQNPIVGAIITVVAAGMLKGNKTKSFMYGMAGGLASEGINQIAQGVAGNALNQIGINVNYSQQNPGVNARRWGPSEMIAN